MTHFTDHERSVLIAVKGVGPTVISRLEEIGIYSFDELAKRSAHDICAEVASVLGSTCWKNSPQSRAAIEAVICCAKQKLS
jgi:predicted RecB family nuclease